MKIENKLIHIQIYLKKLKFANENCDGMGWDELSDWYDQLTHTWKVKVNLHLKSKWCLTIVPFLILSRTRIRKRTRSRTMSRTRCTHGQTGVFHQFLCQFFHRCFHRFYHKFFHRFFTSYSTYVSNDFPPIFPLFFQQG